VDSGDVLAIKPSTSTYLYLSKDSSANQPTVSNTGLIKLNPASGSAYLYASSATATFTGAGTLELGGAGTAYLSYSGAGKFDNDAAHTIRGEGYIQAPVDNYGTLTAQGGRFLSASPSPIREAGAEYRRRRHPEPRLHRHRRPSQFSGDGQRRPGFEQRHPGAY
jgi:hypothetical protein